MSDDPSKRATCPHCAEDLPAADASRCPSCGEHLGVARAPRLLVAATVIGAFDLGLGSLAGIGAALTAANGRLRDEELFGLALYVVTASVHVVAGVGLLRRARWGRALGVGCAGFTGVLGLLGFLVTLGNAAIEGDLRFLGGAVVFAVVLLLSLAAVRVLQSAPVRDELRSEAPGHGPRPAASTSIEGGEPSSGVRR